MGIHLWRDKPGIFSSVSISCCQFLFLAHISLHPRIFSISLWLPGTPTAGQETFKHLELKPVEQELVNCVGWKSQDEMRRPSWGLCWDVPTFPCWEFHPSDECPSIPQRHHGRKWCKFPSFSSSCVVLTFSNLEILKLIIGSRMRP